MGKKIVLSSLAARYYVEDGWTLDVLKEYVQQIGKDGDFFIQDLSDSRQYYILKVGSRIDVKRLLADFPDLEIEPFGGDDFSKSKEELLESRNWPRHNG